LTGVPPDWGAGTNAPARAARGDRWPPRPIDPSIPVEFEAICLKAIAANPAGRYAGAGELAADLRRVLGIKRPGMVQKLVGRSKSEPDPKPAAPPSGASPREDFWK
jgi:hypothetical protein